LKKGKFVALQETSLSQHAVVMYSELSLLMRQWESFSCL